MLLQHWWVLAPIPLGAGIGWAFGLGVRRGRSPLPLVSEMAEALRDQGLVDEPRFRDLVERANPLRPAPGRPASHRTATLPQRPRYPFRRPERLSS